MQAKNATLCSDVNVQLDAEEDRMFLDEKDIRTVLGAERNVLNRSTGSISLRKLEQQLEENPWIAKANLFFDNNHVLQVRVTERTPIARIFTVQGTSFYIDSGARRLPLSDKLSARVPYFTSFPSDRIFLSKADSLVLNDVKKLAAFIVKDSFWNAQVAQVEVLSNRTFEIVPVIGNHTIQIGTSEEIERKLNAMLVFYRQVLAREGFDRYRKINVQFQGQVVASNGGMPAILNDSINTAVADTVLVPYRIAQVKTPALMKATPSSKPKAVMKTRPASLEKTKTSRL